MSVGPVRVRVLGPVSVTGPDGSPVHIGGPRAAAVLAALALAGPGGARTDRLVDAVWGERAPASATRTVQTYLARLRSAAPGLAEARGGGYAIGATVVVDCWQARDRFEAARRVQHDDPAGAARQLRESAALWRGGVAEGAALDGAVDAVRALEELRRDTLAALVAAAERLGDGEVLVDAARQLLRLDPFRETAAAALARHLAARGRRAEALAVVRETRDALVEHLGVEPSAPLREAELAVLRQEIPPERGDRLPTSLSSFVGREADLRAIVDALAGSRLVTIVATGGAGKSRLALEVAHRWREQGRSVLHVGLAGTATGGTGEALRRAAGAGPRVDLADAVAAALPGPAPLLVLDNAEDLLDEVAELAEAVASAHSRLRVLVTSRSALMVAGERVHLLGPLSMTGADGGDATRLLVERAEQVRPGVTTGRVPELIEISRELDGLPLALELAAARLRDVPVTQLRNELADQLDRARLRGGSTRQRSLQAAMAGSVDALDPSARRAHLRLAVVRGWWTDELAVDLLDFLPAHAAPGVIDTLVAASLLVADVAEPVRRLRAYEPVRQDALRRLRDSGAEPEARAAHLRAHLILVRRIRPRLRGPDEAVWLAAVDRARDDLEAALEYARGRSDTAALVELVTCCSRMWSLRWSPSFAVPWLRTALESADEPGSRAVVATDLANLLGRLGDYAQAERLAERALADARRCADPVLLGQACHVRGLVDKDRLRYAAARPWFLEAAAHRHATGDVAGEAMSRGSIADMHAALGQFDEAEAAYAEGLRLMREARSPSGQLAYLHSMAELRVGQADADAAERLLAEAAPLAAGTGDRVHAGLLQLVAAWLDRARARPWERCAASTDEALRLTAASGDVRAILDAVEHAAGVLVDHGRGADAGRLLAAAARHRQRLDARRSATRSAIVARDAQRAHAVLAGPGSAADLFGLVEQARALVAGGPAVRLL